MQVIKDFMEMIETASDGSRVCMHTAAWNVYSDIKSSREYEALKAAVDKPISKMEVTEEKVDCYHPDVERFTDGGARCIKCCHYWVEKERPKKQTLTEWARKNYPSYSEQPTATFLLISEYLEQSK